MNSNSLFLPGALLLTSALLSPAAPLPEGKIQFNRDVRPILSDTCFHCHGFDEKERKAGLRLDVREDALKPAESGVPGIVPGKPEASGILSRIFSTDPDEIMPPSKLHKPLKPEQQEIIRRWIAEGAEYQGHWAFIPPVQTAPLTTTVNPIDGFIQDKLKAAGMTPSAEAPRETLIRRVTLDLTGLPPTPQETEAFVKDPAPDAYERLVDRLLASPRYGEHMAASWLDLARYADSNGFQTDSSRTMWPWRNWVINAFNNNQRFDQFTIEQLAGDLLPDATKDQILATGFNRNHRLNGEGGRIEEEWFVETVIDRVETTGLTWMALTFNCCRCHDHKYDPISQKEFFQFYAYFNSNKESGVIDGSNRAGGNTPPLLDLPTPEQQKRTTELTAAVEKAKAAVDAATKELPALQLQWEKELLQLLDSPAQAWQPLAVTAVKSTGGATMTRQKDGSWLAGGKNPDRETYQLTATPTPGKLTGLLLEVLPDPSLPGGSLGRSPNGNFVLSKIEAELILPGQENPVKLAITRAEADFEQSGWPASHLVSTTPPKPAPRDGKIGWAVGAHLPGGDKARKAVLVCDPVEVPEGAKLNIRLIHQSAHPNHTIGRFRFGQSSQPAVTLKPDGPVLSDAVREALRTAPERRTAAQKKELADTFRNDGDHPAKAATAALAMARKNLTEHDNSILNTMVFEERPEPRPAFVLNRGEYDKPTTPVTRLLPAALPPLPKDQPNNRLGLARWLVSGEHPLTARVWVNRTWSHFFGAGIVKSLENFGSQADWPSHPELLDWLAVEFVRTGWDMKAMQRLIVTSATYRQSSAVTREQLAADPDNRLLARAPRLRLSAESLRDQALAISGLLVEKTGGPSVKPYMPPAVWDETSVYGDMRGYKSETGEGLYRRTLYTIWKRTAAPPSMLLFDSPSREICTVKRTRSNTPMQALALLNEVTYLEAARRLAERMMKEGGTTPAERITWAFRQATSRLPDTFELSQLTKGFQSRLDRYNKDPESAGKLIVQGASLPDPTLPPVELAAFTVTANVILNLDETVTRE